MTGETFDRDFWEARWAQVPREHLEKVANRPPNAHFVATPSKLSCRLLWASLFSQWLRF